MSSKKTAVVLIIAAAIGAWFYFDLGSYLQFDTLQQRVDELREWYALNPLLAGRGRHRSNLPKSFLGLTFVA